jgi:hypothetical protein
MVFFGNTFIRVKYYLIRFSIIQDAYCNVNFMVEAMANGMLIRVMIF